MNTAGQGAVDGDEAEVLVGRETGGGFGITDLRL
jgi:hypothetical protein